MQSVSAFRTSLKVSGKDIRMLPGKEVLRQSKSLPFEVEMRLELRDSQTRATYFAVVLASTNLTNLSSEGFRLYSNPKQMCHPQHHHTSSMQILSGARSAAKSQTATTISTSTWSNPRSFLGHLQSSTCPLVPGMTRR